MDNHYTPINVDQLEGKNNQGNNSTNTILLIIVTLTALVLAIMLFILIQKKLKQSQNQPSTTTLPTPTLKIPSLTPTKVATVSPTIIETTITPEASPTAVINTE